MKMRFLSVLVLLVLSIPAVFSTEMPQPSFDCDKAVTVIEKGICASQGLSVQDRQLARAYKNARSNENLTQALVKKKQLEWLKLRDDCVKDNLLNKACLRSKYREQIAYLSSLVAFDSASVDRNSTPLRVLRVSPSRTAASTLRQIVVTFNKPVVSLGETKVQGISLVSVSPQVNCEWRWYNSTSLSCRLGYKDTLSKATEYTLTVHAGLEAMDGTQLKKDYVSQFKTQSASVTNRISVYSWFSPSRPIHRLNFTQPVSVENVEEQFEYRVGDQVVPVQVIPSINYYSIPEGLALQGEEVAFGYRDEYREDQNFKPLDDDYYITSKKSWLVIPEQALIKTAAMKKNEESSLVGWDKKEEDRSSSRWNNLVAPKTSSVSANEQALLVLKSGPLRLLGYESDNQEKVVLGFHLMPDFSFLGIQCSPNYDYSYYDNKLRLDASKMIQKDEAQCSPRHRPELVFSSPTFKNSVEQGVTFKPSLNRGDKKIKPWEKYRNQLTSSDNYMLGNTFPFDLPIRLMPWTQYQIDIDSSQLVDIFGRSLMTTSSKYIKTKHRGAKFHAKYETGVLEQDVGSQIGAWVRNVNRLDYTYTGLEVSDDGEPVPIAIQFPVTTNNLELSHIQFLGQEIVDATYFNELDYRKITGGKSAVISGNIAANAFVNEKLSSRNNQFFVQVGRLQVLAKTSEFGSLVWVTDLKTGQPVKNARVELVSQKHGSSTDKLTRVTFNGDVEYTNNEGVARFSPDVSPVGYKSFIVTKDKQIAQLPLDYDFRSKDKYSSYSNHYTNVWGFTAQGVYKVGDRVEYKVYLRSEDDLRLKLAPEKKGTLEISGPTGVVVHKQKDIRPSEFGSFNGEFSLPQNATVGWYTASYRSEKRTYSPFKFLVSDFTPSSFKVKADIRQALIGNDDKLETLTSANLLSGGPYRDGKLRLQASFIPGSFEADGSAFSDFRFYDSDDHFSHKKIQIINEYQKLDAQGEFSKDFKLNLGGGYGSIILESSVQDDRGKNIASSASATYSGSDRWLGLKSDSWYGEVGKPSNFQVVVLGPNKKIKQGVDASVSIFRREYKTVKVQGAGGKFDSHQRKEWVKVHDCKLVIKTTSQDCSYTPTKPGAYKVFGTTKNSQGTFVNASIRTWVTGNGYVSWRTDKKTLEIIPESSDLNVGDVARYLVKNPYPGAKALITVERYGVMKSWVQTFDSGLPVVEVPIKKEYSPGFYLSINVFSPRSGEKAPLSKADLGKPELIAGIVRTTVTEPYFEINPVVTTDKPVYQPGDMVKASVKLEGKELTFPHKTELAVIAIDEAVLMLNQQGKDYYDIYKGFYKLKARGVRDYSLITQLIERLKLDKKGTTPGGGGGSAEEVSMRDLFKYIGYWNPSVVSKNGNAEFEFTLPDNLTQWRLFVVSADKAHRLGTGDTTFRVSQPLEIQPAMPNQLTNGDKFSARFTIMNRTQDTQNVEVSINAKGPIVSESGAQTLVKNIDLPPYERVPVTMPLALNGEGKLIVSAIAQNAEIKDAVEHRLPIKNRKASVVVANYGTTTKNSITEFVQIPEDIVPNVGMLSVDLSSSVIGRIDGALNYLRDYSHLCWEQRLSKALAASSYIQLEGHTEVEWDKANDLVIRTLNSSSAFQAPNGGMAYWKPENGRVSPYLSAYTLMGFNRLKTLGYEVPAVTFTSLGKYLQRLIQKDTYPSYYTPNVASSVRAVALRALVEAGLASKNEVRRYAEKMPRMNLFGKAQFLEAAIEVDDGDAVLETLNALLAQSDQTAGKFQFVEPWDDVYKYVLGSSTRANCAILSALVKSVGESSHGEMIGDIPFKLMRSITQKRKGRTYWGNTQENLFCLQAIADYAEVYERVKPDFTASVSEKSNVLGEAAFSDFSGDIKTVSRPLASDAAGSSSQLKINRKGEGRLYYATRLSYALEDSAAEKINAGMEVGREYYVQRESSWQLLSSPMALKRGDLLRVDLFVRLPAPRYYVVVDDPVPGGVEPVNRDLATSSKNDADVSSWQRASDSWWYKYDDWGIYDSNDWSFYHQEIRHDSVSFYADYLPAGNYFLSYTGQVIADGEFSVQPVKVEEMYDPDVFGLGLPATMNVKPETGQ